MRYKVHESVNMEGKKDSKGRQSFITRPVGILKRQLGYKRECPHPNLARVIIPTLPYESLDCSGEKIIPWSLLKLFDSCELSDFWPYQDELRGEHQEWVIYMLNLELEVDEALYIVETPKFPLIIDNTVKYVKKSSRFIESVLQHPEIDRPYAKMSGIDINMDPETRKPKPFPSWWREHYNFPADGEKREFILPKRPKENVYSSKHRVYFSDTDENKHMNYTVYVRFCCDSFCENVLSGKYGTGLNVYEIGLKKLQMTYLKECNLGDIVTVESWEDDVTRDTYHFELRNGPDLSCTATISFYNFLNKQKTSRL